MIPAKEWLTHPPSSLSWTHRSDKSFLSPWGRWIKWWQESRSCALVEVSTWRKHRETEVSVPRSLLLEAHMQPHPTSLCVDAGGCTQTHIHTPPAPPAKIDEDSILCSIACDDVCVCAKPLQSCLFATLWIVAHQAPLSMGFSRQEYWRSLPCPPPWDLPDPGIEPASLASPALAGGFFTTSATWESRPLTLCSTTVSCLPLPLGLELPEGKTVFHYFFFFQFYWEIIGMYYCISLRCKRWWFDFHILWDNCHDRYR